MRDQADEALLDGGTDAAAQPSRSHAVRALLWRAPVAAVSGVAVSVLLALPLLALAGAAQVDGPRDEGQLIRVLLPYLALLVAVGGGVLWGMSAVARLVQDGRQTEGASLRTALRASARAVLPVVRVLLAVAVLVLLSVVLWILVGIAGAVRAVWRWRRHGDGRAALRGLWICVPGLPALALLAALPRALSAVVAGHRARGALRGALRSPVRAHLVALVGVGAAVAAVLGLQALTPPVAADASGAALLPTTAVTVLLLLVIGVALGLVRPAEHHVRSDRQHPGGDGAAGADLFVPAPRRARRTVRAGVTPRTALALVLAAVLSLEVLPGAMFSSAGANEGAGTVDPGPGSTAPLVVTTLADTAVPAPGECLLPDQPCGVRAALEIASDRAQSRSQPLPRRSQGDAVEETVPEVVRFGVSGTVVLSGGLAIGGGVTLDGATHTVTIDANGAGLVVQDTDADQGRGEAGLARLTVTGGRSNGSGAGLSSFSNDVRLEQVVFRDNAHVPGTFDRTFDGGAVHLEYGHLTVIDSTFTGNRITGYGAAAAARTMEWVNSTSFDDVGATGVDGKPYGGAIFATESLLLRHVTVVGGGGVAVAKDGDLQIINSVVQPAMASFSCGKIDASGGSVGTAAASLSLGTVEPDGSCDGLRASPQPLGPLADNGGRTPTMALLSGSLATGAGVVERCEVTDQRGIVRPPGGRCDAGAFQREGGQALVTVALTSTPNPSVLGVGVDLTAQLSPAAALPDGTVQFFSGSTPLGAPQPVDRVGARADLRVTALPAGEQRLTAVFTSTDPLVGPATSNAVTHHVRIPASIEVTAPAPVRLHAPVVVSARVVPAAGVGDHLVPSGNLNLSVGDLSASVPLVNGLATWSVDALPAATVRAVYPGDDLVEGASVETPVTTVDIPTTTTAALDETAPSFGEPVELTVHVSDEAGAVPGHVQLLVDGTATVRQPLLAGVARFPLDLPVGEHQLVAVSEPGAGRTSSRAELSYVVGAARSAVSLQAPDRLEDGQVLNATAHVLATGPVTVQLLEGATVLATVSGARSGPVPLTVPALTPGIHSLVARVVGTAEVQEATSAPVVVTVARRTTALVLEAPPVRVGSPAVVMVTAVPSTRSGALTLTDATSGLVLATGRLTAGAGELTYLARTVGVHDLHVALRPDLEDQEAPAEASVVLTVLPAVTQAPATRWESVGPTSAVLHVLFLDPTLTGRVSVGSRSGEHGSAQLVPGPGGSAAVVQVTVDAGNCWCAGRGALGPMWLVYEGSTSAEPLTAELPDLEVPAHVTAVVLDDLPTTVARDGVVELRATVSSPTSTTPPVGTIGFVVNGAYVGQAAVDSAGRATVSHAPVRRGPLSVTARFLPSTNAFSASPASAPVNTEVLGSPVPDVLLEALDTPRAGHEMRVQVRPATAADAALVRRGFAIRDQHGNELARGTWGVWADRAAVVTVVPRFGGPLRLVAEFWYGPDDDTAVSAPLELNVLGVPAALQVTHALPQPARAGVPLLLEVRMPPRAHPHGPLPLVLKRDGVELGVAGTLEYGGTTRLTDPSPPAGVHLYEVATPGDGGDVSAGRGGDLVTVHRNPVVLAAPPSESPLGRAWTVPFSLAGVDGLPAPTGTVTVSVSSGTSCTAVLPATSCVLVPEGDQVVGDHALELNYSGDALYSAARAAGRTTVRQLTSAVSVTYDADPNSWLVGQTIRARWTATREDGRATGVVRLLYRAIGPGSASVHELCSAAAPAGGCTFTVRAPGAPLTGRKDTVEAEYTPGERVLASTASSPALATRCASLTLLETLATDGDGRQYRVEHVPIAKGTPCSVAGRAGYLEGRPLRMSMGSIAPYVVTGYDVWTDSGRVDAPMERQARDGMRPGDLELWPAEDLRLRALLDYRPACVTVRFAAPGVLQVEGSRPERPAGRLEVLTAPDCAAPSPDRLPRDLDGGIGEGRYAVGTTLEVVARPRTSGGPTVKDPTFVVAGVPGMRRDAAVERRGERFSVVLTKDLVVTPHFRLGAVMCRPVSILAGPGGRVEIETATKPDLGAYRFEDAQGRCRTEQGTPGFLSGTTLTLRATPINSGAARPALMRDQYFLRTWADDAALSTPERRADVLAPVVQGTRPDPAAYRPARAVVVVPEVGSLRYGAAFASVSCVPVEASLTWSTVTGRTRTPPDLAMTPSNCSAYDEAGARPHNEDGTTAPALINGYGTESRVTRRVVRHYLAGTAVNISAPPYHQDGAGLPRPLAGGDGHGTPGSWSITSEGRPTSYASRKLTSGRIGTSLTAVPGVPLRVGAGYAAAVCEPVALTVLPSSALGKVVNGLPCGEGAYDTRDGVTLAAFPWEGVRPVWLLHGGARVRSGHPGRSVIKESPESAVPAPVPTAPPAAAITAPSDRGGAWMTGLVESHGGGFIAPGPQVSSSDSSPAADGDLVVVRHSSLWLDAWTGGSVTLLYCKPVTAQVEKVLYDARGGLHTDLSRVPREIQGLPVVSPCPDPGEAPAGMTAPVRVAGLESTAVRLKGWSVKGKTAAGPPTVRVPLFGPVTDVLRLDLQVTCFVLQVKVEQGYGLPERAGPERVTRTLLADQDTGPGDVPRTSPISAALPPRACPYQRHPDNYLKGTVVGLDFQGDSEIVFRQWYQVDLSDGDVAVVVMDRYRGVTAQYEYVRPPSRIDRAVGGIADAGKVLSNVLQRGLALGVAALTKSGLTIAGTILRQTDSIMGGLAAVIELTGGPVELANMVRGVGVVITKSVDILYSVGDCLSIWAGGGAGPIRAAGGSTAATGASVGGKVLNIADLALDNAASGRSAADSVGRGVLGAGDTSAGKALAAVDIALDAVDMFGGNLDSYLADPVEAWSGITAVGSCMKDKGLAVADAAENVGTGRG